MNQEPKPAAAGEPEIKESAPSSASAPKGEQAGRHIDRGVSPRELNLLRTELDERERKVERFQRRLTAIEGLVDCTRSLTSILDLDTLLGEILHQVVKLSGFDRAFFLLAEPDGELHLERGFDARRGLLPNLDASQVSDSVVRDTYRERKRIYISELANRPDLCASKSMIELNLSVIACFPLEMRDIQIGVLYLDSTSPVAHVTEEDLSVLDAFAAQASIAFENARRHREELEARALVERENRDLRRVIPGARGVEEILGRSAAIEALRRRIGHLQEVDSPVLILGEMGTGKDLVARAIHTGGPRADEPFLPLHCGAIAKDLIETELFGYKKGAFTGALQDHPGMFEAANGGTLFLDEIGEMPYPLQPALLRVLENNEIRRVGDTVARRVNVRVLSATHRDLRQMIAEKTFREDLFYRLSVVTVRVPSLADRVEDVPLLAEHFLRRYLEQRKRPYAGMTESAVRFMVNFTWRGNVRQLRNMIESACVFLQPGTPLTAEDLSQAAGDTIVGAESRDEPKPANLREHRDKAERQRIIQALNENNWNVSKAARILGISRQHLHSLMRSHAIERQAKQRA